MKNSKAVILTCSPEPEKICASSARISSTKGSATGIYKNTSRDNIGKLISSVVALGHVTITEHATFTIAFEDVSAFVEQFLIEFRLASFTIKSRRYVDYSDMGCFQPDIRFHDGVSPEDRENFKEAFSSHIDHLFSEYTCFVSSGIPKEDARFMLPYNFRSHIYCTVNARELMHMIYSAIHGRGSRFPEIKKLGESLLDQATKILPDVFEHMSGVEKGSEEKEFKLREILSEKIQTKREEGELTELLTFTNNPEKVVALSAIIGNTGCDTEMAASLLEKDPGLFSQVLDVVQNHRRGRELEQAAFTFRINGISLAGLTHLARHRIQSVVIPSFTEFGKSSNYIVPETIQKDGNLHERYLALCRKSNEFFDDARNAGVVDEDLVYLYLSGNLLDVVTSMNARQLYHFLKLRTCDRAQWEIRDIAVDMLKKLRTAAPLLFNHVGPGCYMNGTCPEGKMSCGKQKEVADFFAKLE